MQVLAEPLLRQLSIGFFQQIQKKFPFFLQINPNNIIKTVEVIALTIDISVKVDRKMSNKFIFSLLLMFIYPQFKMLLFS